MGILVFVFCLVGCERKAVSTTQQTQPADPFPITHFPERLALVGEQACRTCHAEIFESWSTSHHAKANRPIREELDKPAFTPAQSVTEGDSTYRMEWKEGKPIMIATEGGEEITYPLEGVLAYEPLRQYLVPFPGGKWQTTTAAYDPSEGDWFDVYEGEARRPGEWGHWTGQGMNWNANCAYCHTTGYHKNIDAETGDYHSTWTRQGISCVQCHSGLEEHVKTAKPNQGGELPALLSPVQVVESCASCHSRRDQLTAEEFRPGDSFHDHFGLSLPTRPGLYYPDGQIRDEVFVFGSFSMSRMGGHAGVTCMDCHDSHSMELKFPAHNNAACMWCHDSGLREAPIIDPVVHSRHAEGSTGNQCVECHMPETTYMQRDPRRDHGFLSPDPLLTRELGIPNACNSCHTEESVEWAESKVEEWYPEKKVIDRQRLRAKTVSEAWEQNPATIETLLQLAQNDPVDAWRATYTGLLAPFSTDPSVRQFLREQMKDSSPLVRAEAARASAYMPTSVPEIDDLLSDPSRNVRLAAAHSAFMREGAIENASTAQEWKEYLLFNSDRPQPTLILAQQAIQQGENTRADHWIARAIALEPDNPDLQREAAILYSQSGNAEAATQAIETAYSLAPDRAIFPYSLALIRAEEGKLTESMQLLTIATRLDPGFDRAWYNLALALLRNGEPIKARRALDQAVNIRQTPEWYRASQAINQAILERQ
tara:strand:- start:8137 stop:10266 length:2130 start_codon:yes stop_codon:yes gene_type:complete